MKLSCPSCRIVIFVALASILFMQLAVTSYAGPSWTLEQNGTHTSMSADAGNQSIIGCVGLDKAQPNLCFVQAQVGKQFLDKPDMPHAQPFIAAELSLVLLENPIARKHHAAQPFSFFLTRPRSPALSIIHCCFRI